MTHDHADFHKRVDRIAAKLSDIPTRTLHALRRHTKRCLTSNKAGGSEAVLYAINRELLIREPQVDDGASTGQHVLLAVENLSLTKAGKAIKFC